MRFGLIGCGGIGAIRAAAVDNLPGTELVATTDVDAARAQALALRCRCAAVADWQALVARRDLDAVIVSTPPHLHAPMAIAALRAGKHVLCEKPLARTSAECRTMLDAAAQAGKLLATGFNYRFYPSMQKARELLDSGIIGELDHIRSYAGYSAKDHNPPWVHDVEVMGGGALRDNGIHLIDLTQWFLGDVAEVKGFASGDVWNFAGCEDNGFALLRNSNGRIATLQASWTEWRGYRLLIELYGTRGCVRAWCFPMMTEVVFGERPGAAMRRKKFLFPMTFVREHLRSYRALVLDSFIAELNAFMRAVAGDVTPIGTGADGLRAIEIAEGASSSVGFADSVLAAARNA